MALGLLFLLLGFASLEKIQGEDGYLREGEERLLWLPVVFGKRFWFG